MKTTAELKQFLNMAGEETATFNIQPNYMRPLGCLSNTSIDAQGWAPLSKKSQRVATARAYLMLAKVTKQRHYLIKAKKCLR